MKLTRYRYSFLIVGVVILLISCSHDPVGNNKQLHLSGIFKAAGLSGISIWHLNLYKGNLYAATDNGCINILYRSKGS